MAGNDAAQKIFEALNESSDAFIDAVRASNDRGHRFSAAVIEQAQESQRSKKSPRGKLAIWLFLEYFALSIMN